MNDKKKIILIVNGVLLVFAVLVLLLSLLFTYLGKEWHYFYGTLGSLLLVGLLSLQSYVKKNE